MVTNNCRFPADGLEAMARFCAELTRQGVAFNSYSVGDGWIVEITGY